MASATGIAKADHGGHAVQRMSLGTKPAALTERVRFQKKTPDGFQDVDSRAARVSTPTRGRNSHTVVVRFDRAIKRGDRFVYGERPLVVVDTDDYGASKVFLFCQCREITPSTVEGP